MASSSDFGSSAYYNRPAAIAYRQAKGDRYLCGSCHSRRRRSNDWLCTRCRDDTNRWQTLPASAIMRTFGPAGKVIAPDRIAPVRTVTAPRIEVLWLREGAHLVIRAQTITFKLVV